MRTNRFALSGRRDYWHLAVVLLAGLVMVPIGVIFASLVHPEQDIWSHLADTMLATLVVNTFWLSLGVLLGTFVLGVSLGWLTGACSFPGRAFFSWALTLPMAIPAYVMAFIFIGVMDFTGPIQSFIRTVIGIENFMVEVRSTPFVVLVLSLTLYPYVYLLSRAAFLSQGKTLLEAARTLGTSPWGAFCKVLLPMARPWIVSGLVLVLMETLADFGAVSIFNYDTFTTAIYKAWFGFFSLNAAAQLSSVLVVFALALVLVEGLYRSKMRFYANSKGGSVHARLVLQGTHKIIAILFCSLILLVAFVLPCAQLIFWAWQSGVEYGFPDYHDHLFTTMFLGGCGALLTCLAALVLSYAKRKYPTSRNNFLCKLATMGYALPGTVLAVGIFVPVAWLDNNVQHIVRGIWGLETGPLLQGTVLVMFMAYVVRFLAAGFGGIDATMQAINPNLDEAASIAGVKGWRLIRQIHLPLLKKGALTALIMVMIDIVKEMPITLMTRPFGWDTLAVKIYELTSEGEWERAALPGLYLVLVSTLPVFILMRESEKNNV